MEHGSDESSNSEEKSVDTNKGGNNSTNFVNRRTFLGSTSAATAIALAGCVDGGGSGNTTAPPETSDTTVPGEATNNRPFEGETLTVAVWSGSYAEDFEQEIVPLYEEETGATIEIVPVWSEIVAKIKSAPADQPPYDLTISEEQYYHMMVQEELNLPIRTENVPNLEHVKPYLIDHITPHADNAVPVSYTAHSQVYRNDLGWEPETWQDFLSDEATNVAMEGGFFIYPVLIGAAMSNEQPGAEELYSGNHDAIFEALEQVDMAQWYATSADHWQAFEQEVIDVSQFYYTFAVDRTRFGEFDHLSLNVPEGTSMDTNIMSVVRGTQKRDMAEHFLNWWLREDIQTEWSHARGIGPAHTDAGSPDYMKDDGFPLTNEAVSKMAYVDWGYLEDHSADLSERWKELKQQTG